MFDLEGNLFRNNNKNKDWPDDDHDEDSDFSDDSLGGNPNARNFPSHSDDSCDSDESDSCDSLGGNPNMIPHRIVSLPVDDSAEDSYSIWRKNYLGPILKFLILKSIRGSAVFYIK